jgi:hypothetical protein
VGDPGSGGECLICSRETAFVSHGGNVSLVECLNELENVRDGWSVSGTNAYMMYSHLSTGINEHIAAPLSNIVMGHLRVVSLGDFFGIGPGATWVPDIKKTGCEHVVLIVETSSTVDEQWPLQFRLGHIGLGKKIGLKCNNGYIDLQSGQFIFLLSQLRQVLAAGQSTQVAMKHEKQPSALEIAELVFLSVRIGQDKVNCISSRLVGHSSSSASWTSEANERYGRNACDLRRSMSWKDWNGNLPECLEF